MLDNYSKFCKEKDPSLPVEWEAYLFESLPREFKPTHLRIVGSVPRFLKSGKNKGRKTWKDKVQEREYIFSFEEIREEKIGEIN
jgi:hypothetical protein